MAKYLILFKFLAPRFLLAPDHVLDAERIHARWQWLCSLKRAMKLQTLNATLRLMHHLEHNEILPDSETLLDNLEAQRQQHNMALEAVDEDVALGWRSEFLYRDRFNLSAADRDLVADNAPAPVVPAPPGGPFALAWRHYMKSVFQKGFMYRVSCNASVVLYVAENKTLAGKEDRAYEGEAMGRKLALVFFEDADAGMVRRVDRGHVGMTQELLTLAELLQTLGGIVVPADPGRTAAQTEVLLESLYQGLDIQRIKCTLEPGAPEVHIYSLDDAVPAEAAFCNEAPADHRTKMALARALQRNGEFHPGETLQVAWNSSLADLRGRTAHLWPVPAGPAAPPAGPAAPPAGPAAPPAGRGKGRGGRGRGGGKGRGGRG